MYKNNRYFYKLKFNNEIIEKIKTRRKLKDEKMGGNYFEYENRWAGDIGELTFREWLKKYPRIFALTTHYTNQETKDLMDFSIGDNYKIDVKTTYAKYRQPTLFDNCIVNSNQIEKNNTDQKINCYVFCRFFEQDLTCYIMGFIFYDEFISKSNRWNKGDIIRENVNFVAMADCYDVLVLNLKNIDELFMVSP